MTTSPHNTKNGRDGRTDTLASSVSASPAQPDLGVVGIHASFEEHRFSSAETIVAQDSAFPWGAVAPPLYQSSLFTFPTMEAMTERFRGKTNDPIYSRVDNPTVVEFEQKLAKLEEAEAARAFSSGMGAISSAVLSQVQSGDRIVCVKHVYPDAYRLFMKLFSRFNIQVDFVDGRDLFTIEKSLPGAVLLFIWKALPVSFLRSKI